MCVPAPEETLLRYTPEKVSEITGTPVEDLLKVYEMFSSTGVKDKAGTVLYALGGRTTRSGPDYPGKRHHSVAAGQHRYRGRRHQRLRGQPNVQGSTDGCLLVPSYSRVPESAQSFSANPRNIYEGQHSEDGGAQSANWWQNTPKYTVSLLKSFFGDKAPKRMISVTHGCRRPTTASTYSWFDMCDVMHQGKIKVLHMEPKPCGEPSQY